MMDTSLKKLDLLVDLPFLTYFTTAWVVTTLGGLSAGGVGPGQYGQVFSEGAKHGGGSSS